MDPAVQDEARQVQSLLEAVFSRYGYDFRDYAFSSIHRRIRASMYSERVETIPQLQERLLEDPRCMERFVVSVTVSVTTMFRDPQFYAALRCKVVPLIREQPFVRIWHAGCATGEEVYSTAILLTEEGLYRRARLYATDVNQQVIAKAKAGIFPSRALSEYERNYEESGGRRGLAHYYTAMYGHIIFRRALKENIIFSQHNLVTDKPFSTFDVILCRNVMIYFNQQLTQQVHHLLYDSLRDGGFLCLGMKESIDFTPYAGAFEAIDANTRIYQKTGQSGDVTPASLRG